MRKIPVFLLIIVMLSASTNAQVYLGSNGLSVSGTGTSATVALGGTLAQNTDIDLNGVYNLNFKNGSSPYLSILSNGIVGIGTTTPNSSTKLDVAGAIRSTRSFYIDRLGGDLSNYFFINARSSTEGSNFGNMLGNGAVEVGEVGTSGVILGSITGSIGFGIGYGAAGRVFPNGNWYLGASPVDAGYKLQVDGPVCGSYFTNSTVPLGVYYDAAVRLRWGGLAGSYIDFYDNDANTAKRATIASGADSRPMYFTDAIGFSFMNTPIVNIGSEWGVSDQARLAIENQPGATVNALSIARATGTADVYDLAVKSSGNVLIGTNSDAGFKLDVAGTSRFNNSIFLQGTTYFQSALNYVTNGFSDIQNPNAMVNFPGDGSIGISTGASASARRLTVLPNGNIGIGTANPQATLAVNGNIFAQKVKVTQTGWSDYVFEKNYPLPTLAQVEQYIQTNKHLPDVPSAAMVEKDGLDLGDNQATLLKKIEELTLYLIEDHKRMDVQQKQLAEQQQKIEALEKALIKSGSVK